MTGKYTPTLYKANPDGYWFHDDTMAFFNCILPAYGYKSADGDYFFTSSEKGPSMKRAYSVRHLTKEGRMERVGEFNSYSTQARANTAAMNAANGWLK